MGPQQRPVGSTMYRRITAAGRTVTIDLGKAKHLATGGAGHVYQDPTDPGLVIKIYKDRATARAHRDKVLAMLDNPPGQQIISSNGRRYVQIAWPQGVVETGSGEFAGFSMPLVLLSDTKSGADIVQRKRRQQSGLREDFPFRITVGRNMASVVRELHDRGHFVIDLHEANVKVYEQDGFICLLDTDGYSVDDRRGGRFPAAFVLSEIVGPEGQGQRYQDLGEEQDRYALAVLLFKLLNEGLNPFQGVPKAGQTVPNGLIDRIKLGLYAYGLQPGSVQAPSPSSIHDWLDTDTRALFDRAFASGPPRPTAEEWRDHFDDLLSRLQPCPKDDEHWHFSGGCPWCNAPRPPASSAKIGQVVAPAARGAKPHGPLAAGLPPARGWVAGRHRGMASVVLALLAGGALASVAWLALERSAPPSSASVSASSQAPTTTANPAQPVQAPPAQTATSPSRVADVQTKQPDTLSPTSGPPASVAQKQQASTQAQPQTPGETSETSDRPQPSSGAPSPLRPMTPAERSRVQSLYAQASEAENQGNCSVGLAKLRELGAISGTRAVNWNSESLSPDDTQLKADIMDLIERDRRCQAISSARQ
jgi:hypothetical protein